MKLEQVMGFEKRMVYTKFMQCRKRLTISEERVPIRAVYHTHVCVM